MKKPRPILFDEVHLPEPVRRSFNLSEPQLTPNIMTYRRHTMAAVLTVRLTKEEQGILAQRSKRAGMKKATFVRKLIRDEEIVTGADLAGWASRHAGDVRLRITPRR